MTIYIGVMALEFAPALFERLGWKVSLQRLNKVMFFIIALGALLPTMHQSSMGSLMISAGYKVHPLWQSYEMLPLFSLLHTGKDIMLGKTYTKAECKTLLNKDLATVARQINPYIKVDIPETTRGALYSFVYNVGAGNFRTSTLLRKINQGDIKGACDQLRRWTYAGGKQWKGLMTRREIEREICLWGQQ